MTMENPWIARRSPIGTGVKVKRGQSAQQTQGLGLRHTPEPSHHKTNSRVGRLKRMIERECLY